MKDYSYFQKTNDHKKVLERRLFDVLSQMPKVFESKANQKYLVIIGQKRRNAIEKLFASITFITRERQKDEKTKPLKIERPQESNHAAQTEKKKRKKGETERKTRLAAGKQKKEEREESCGESGRSAAATPSVLSFSSTSVKLV